MAKVSLSYFGQRHWFFSLFFEQQIFTIIILVNEEEFIAIMTGDT
jgi:hypothetical protein